MATTLLALEALLSEAIGDFLEFDTSTNIAASSKSIISTTLQNYDGGQDGYFDDWWVYITEGVNIGVGRQVSAGTTYATATGTLTVRGANLSAETAAVTCRLHRFNRDNKVKALNRAMEQLYSTLYKPLDDLTLVTGNILPNAHFEDWASTANPDYYEVSNAAASAIAIAGSIRAGTKSMRVIPSSASGYAYIRASSYPRLLDLSGKTVNFYAWAYPQVTDDPSLVIYTKNIAGSTQTLTSTTTAASAQFTLLKLESQKLNDNLIDCQFRFVVASSTKYTYFDDAVVCGMNLYEYPLPSSFQQATVSQVRIQTEGYSSTAIPIPCYDILPKYWSPRQDFRIFREGDYSPTSIPPVFDRLQFYYLPSNYYRMRLQGYAPLGTLSADTDTIFLDGEKLNLIIAKAKAILYRMESSPVSSQDKGRYKQDITEAEDEVRRLTPGLMMQVPSSMIQTGE